MYVIRNTLGISVAVYLADLLIDVARFLFFFNEI